MGFSNTATTITVTAKLTSLGRQKLLTGNTNVITHFSLGDSDANYNTPELLSSGEVPASSGTLNNNLYYVNNNTQLRSLLLRDSLDRRSNLSYKKSVQPNSVEVLTTKEVVGPQVVSGSTVTPLIIDRTDSTSSTINLFKSFNLPISIADKTYFNDIQYPIGFGGSALEHLNQDNILVIPIPNETYGELIDGKSIHVSLPVSGNTYEIYSTFQQTVSGKEIQDGRNIETSTDLRFKSNTNNPLLVGYNKLGNNVTFLFSDQVKRPNGDSTKSWSTGYGSFKPFSTGGKEQFNISDNENLSISADTAVGVAYLDMGFIVITHPLIVDSYDESLFNSSVITFNTIQNKVEQKITCLIERGEYKTSTNSTFIKESGDVPRISEVALWDETERLIGYGKLDRQVELNNDMFMALGVKIIL